MQRNAVAQLDFIGWHGCGQGLQRGGIGVGRVQLHPRHGLQHGHALQQSGQLLQRTGSRNAVDAQNIHRLHQLATIAGGQGMKQRKHMAAIDRAQHLAHGGLLQLPAAKGDGLIGQAERIAHRASGPLGQQTQRLLFKGHALLGQHGLQMLQHGLRGHRAQVELQAAREHGDRHFLRIGGGQDKFQVLGRLFQRFQHGVERGVGEHVHLVDHEDLEAPLHRFVHRLLQQALHLVHPAVGGGIQLDIVGKASAINFCARRANTARRSGDRALPIRPCAIERLGQDARHRGLAHATRASEHIGMVQALLRQRIGQGLHDVLLPHHFGEVAGTVFTSEH